MATALELVLTGGKEYRAGRYPQAEAAARQALQIEPNNVYALNLLGAAQMALGRRNEAIGNLSQALLLKPDYGEACKNLGTTYAAEGKLAEAAEHFRRAGQLQPNYFEAQENLGGVLLRLKRYGEAETAYAEAVRLRPDNADSQNNLGVALLRQKKFAEALLHFQQASRLRPDDHRFHGGAAAACHGLGNPVEAEVSLREVVRLRPDDAEAHNGLGWSNYTLGRFAEAKTHLDEALRLQPEHAQAHLNRSIWRLLHGDYAEGWSEYEWRWKGKDLKLPPFKQPLWDGSPLHGRSILLFTEQGLGDALHFVRYAPLVKARGGEVLLACERKLAPLLSRCPGVDRIIIKGDPHVRFDVYIPLLSLPRLFGTTADAPPAGVPYVHPDPERAERWRRELSDRRAFKVGIVWRGSPKNPEDRQRSIPLAFFEWLSRVEGVQLYSLQKGPGSEELKEAVTRFPIIDLGPRLDEGGEAFVDTAAVLKALDLVVACDTAVAHLAGAMGAPAWIALPFSPDWRWMLNREDSPWYPSLRLFRQAERGHWGPVFEHMAAELARTATRRPGALAAPVAAGELIDKITILEIKRERMADAAKVANVVRELEALAAVRDRGLPPSEELSRLTAEVKAANEKLWDVEDEIRRCEVRADFGPRFVELARSVYRTNDRRAALKRMINELLGSALVEEKSYAS